MKSSPSLKIVEYDVFISRMPISRQIETIVESRMFIVTMSGGALRAAPAAAAPVIELRLHDRQPDMAVRAPRSAAHSTHQSEQKSACLPCLRL